SCLHSSKRPRCGLIHLLKKQIIMNTIFKYIGMLFFMLFTISLVRAQEITQESYKKNINNVTEGIKKIKTLEPISFQYDSNNDKELSKRLPTGERFGFMENSIVENFPSLITSNSYLIQTGKN